MDNEEYQPSSSDDEEVEDDTIIGIRNALKRTNYRYRYDALNQRDVARRNVLQDNWLLLHNSNKKLLCIIVLLYQMICINQLTTNGRLVVYPILILYLCYQQARLSAIERELEDNRLSQPPSAAELAADPTLQFIQVLEVALELFRVWAFIDCTDMRTARPGSGPQPDGSRRVNAHEIQLEIYSRYFRAHGLKFLSLLLPNGLVGTVF